MKCPRNTSICVRNSSGKYGNVVNAPVIKNFALDIPATRKLGVEYLFSVTIISNAEDLGLKYMGEFDSAESRWRIFVYKLPK